MILVTGATGLSGAIVVQEFARQGQGRLARVAQGGGALGADAQVAVGDVVEQGGVHVSDLLMWSIRLRWPGRAGTKRRACRTTSSKAACAAWSLAGVRGSRSGRKPMP